jgi:hypothetical protein
MLLEELRKLETEMHTNETRCDRNRMETLLHPDFVEFARSGKQHTRAEVLNEFSATDALPAIHSEDFRLAVLAQDAALLTYRSAHVDPAGNLDRDTLRSSVWVSTEIGWQIRFHQGTPIVGARE